MTARNTDIGMGIDKDDHPDTNTTICKALLRGESGDTPAVAWKPVRKGFLTSHLYQFFISKKRQVATEKGGNNGSYGVVFS